EWRWRYRGDNLCAWETGLKRALGSGEIVIDPQIGRVLIGLDTAAQADALIVNDAGELTSRMYASYTYGAPGPVGAHPVGRSFADAGTVDLRRVGEIAGGTTLQAALNGLAIAGDPVVIEIH